ncbi:hypothetical protein SUGI_0939310 [Cryptomeria japonica]|nr:hypothetical protein SUGI_0939310 [Cryptomeria japonica]
MLSLYRNPPVCSEEEDHSNGGGALRIVKFVSSNTEWINIIFSKRCTSDIIYQRLRDETRRNSRKDLQTSEVQQWHLLSYSDVIFGK